MRGEVGALLAEQHWTFMGVFDSFRVRISHRIYLFIYLQISLNLFLIYIYIYGGFINYIYSQAYNSQTKTQYIIEDVGGEVHAIAASHAFVFAGIQVFS